MSASWGGPMAAAGEKPMAVDTANGGFSRLEGPNRVPFAARSALWLGDGRLGWRTPPALAARIAARQGTRRRAGRCIATPGGRRFDQLAAGAAQRAREPERRPRRSADGIPLPPQRRSRRQRAAPSRPRGRAAPGRLEHRRRRPRPRRRARPAQGRRGRDERGSARPDRLIITRGLSRYRHRDRPLPHARGRT